MTELTTALTQWVDCNGLKLNLKKTNYMIFSKKKVENTQNIFINNTRIERKSEAKFLGVIVDDKLTWAHHIKAIRTKMNRYVGIMYRIKNLLPCKARLQIFHSFIQSHLNFCPLVWGFAAKCHIDSLFTSQKKGLRATVPGHINLFYKEGVLPTHTKPFFKEHKILTVHNIIATNTLLFMHKINSFPRSLPLSVRETIASDAPVCGSDHDTCQELLAVYGSDGFSKSVFFKGPLLFIDHTFSKLINPSTKLSYKAYRKQAKSLLLDLQNQSDDECWQAENFVLNTISGLRRSKRHMSEPGTTYTT